MYRQMLKSKIHRATITEACLEYVGSLSVDPELLQAADIFENEKILVVNLNNGARLETYAITGGPGEICLNGAAARLGQPGDKIIIITFATMDDAEAKSHQPQVVHVDEKNAIVIP